GRDRLPARGRRHPSVADPRGFRADRVRGNVEAKARYRRERRRHRLAGRDGETGYLVDTVEQAGARLVELFLEPDRAAAMGIAARARVRERFLTTRNLADFLDLFESLSA